MAQIAGGVVGAVIGFYVGGPAGAFKGWMIGSAIGGAYAASQQVIQGPKIGDVTAQTSQEGGPRPIVFGRSHPIAGNVIADGGPRIVKKRERQGKGGPKVESESAFRTYAVGFCEGPITAFTQVWRNNILVYDAEDPSMALENAEFLKYARFFLGGWDQMPSPDLEAVYGAGNVHGHRGTAYIVFADEDVTDMRGMWSQWMVRVKRGAAKSFTTPPYPVLVVESMVESPAAQGVQVLGEQLEVMNEVSTISAFEFRTVLVEYETDPEEMQESNQLIALDLYNPLVEVDGRFEAMNESGNVTGLLINNLVSYNNYPPEEMNEASDLVGVSLV